MNTRPIIKIKLTQVDKVLEVIGIFLLVMVWVITIINYFTSADTVAIHFNLSGEPDRYGSKRLMLFIPIIPTFLFIALTKLCKYPHLFNYTTYIKAANAENQYRIATRMLRLFKVAIVLIFAVEIFATLLVAVGIFNGLGIYFLPLTLLILAVPITYSFVAYSKSATLKN